MSYSIYLEAPPRPPVEPCPTCGHCPQAEDEDDDVRCPNPTYNLTGIFDLALTGAEMPNADVPEVAVVLFRQRTDRPRGLRLLNGRKAGETAEDLATALRRMEDEQLQARFAALLPENGWGTMDGARKVLRELRRLADEYPDRVWSVC